MTIKAVAFDVDGTLYPDSALRIRSVPFALRHAPLLVAMAEVRQELHRRAAGPRHEGEPCDLESFRRQQAGLLAKRLGLSVDEAEGRVERAIYGELEGSFHSVPLYAGVVECLETLKAAGLPLAVLSDFPAERKVEALGLGRFFAIRLTSEASGLLKPAARPFLALASALGHEPGEILYVGNSLRYDIAGAREAGMPCALRSSHPRLALRKARAGGHAEPDFAFSSFDALPPWVLTRTTPTR